MRKFTNSDVLLTISVNPCHLIGLAKQISSWEKKHGVAPLNP